jgi:hypothetical protein
LDRNVFNLQPNWPKTILNIFYCLDGWTICLSCRMLYNISYLGLFFGGLFNGLTFSTFLVNVNIFHSCWYSLNLFVSCYDILMFNVQSGKIQFSHFEGGRSTTRMLIRSVRTFDWHFFASIVPTLHVILHFRLIQEFLKFLKQVLLFLG